MNRRRQSFVARVACVAIGGVAIVAGPVPTVHTELPNDSGVIISEVYGGGGNAGAVYTNDFVELYNTTDEAIDLTGWSVQYKSATGASFSGLTPLSGSIPADGHFLVQQAASTAGGTAPLPVPDVAGSIAMSATDGVVALVANSSALTCTGGSCSTDAAVRDLVGFGTANTFAGTAAAPALTNSTSASRTDVGANTWDNATDFTAGVPSPVSSAVIEPLPDATIAEIQGTGDVSPVVGRLATTEGVVTAAYPTGGYTGFVIQTEGTGGATSVTPGAASEAVFVSSVPAISVAPGDFVEVTGLVGENAGLTTMVVTDADDVVAHGEPVRGARAGGRGVASIRRSTRVDRVDAVHAGRHLHGQQHLPDQLLR